MNTEFVMTYSEADWWKERLRSAQDERDKALREVSRLTLELIVARAERDSKARVIEAILP